MMLSRKSSEEAVSLLLQHGAWQKEPRKREVLTHAEAVRLHSDMGRLSRVYPLQAQRMQHVIVAAGIGALMLPRSLLWVVLPLDVLRSFSRLQ